MALGILIMVFIVIVMVIFFVVISGGVSDMWDTLKDILQYKVTSAFLGAGILLALFIVAGGGVSRDGLTVLDVVWLCDYLISC